MHAIGTAVMRYMLSCAILLVPVTNTAFAQNQPSKVHSRGVVVVRPTQTVDQPVAPVSTPAKTCTRPFAKPDLSLSSNVETASFDKALDKRLDRHHKIVVVDLRQPAAIGADLPPQLQPWLAAAKSGGGGVSVDQYCQTTRGLFSFLRRIAVKDPRPIYASAALYDVVFHVDGRDQVVTQVEFRPRAKR